MEGEKERHLQQASRLESEENLPRSRVCLHTHPLKRANQDAGPLVAIWGGIAVGDPKNKHHAQGMPNQTPLYADSSYDATGLAD